MKRPSPSPLPRTAAAMSAILTLALFAAHCSVDQAPAGLRATPAGTGPEIVFDIERQPLPEIPQPNDVATFPDPTSRTGRRINVSEVAPTTMETVARQGFDNMEGWGTFAPITVAFDREPGSDPSQAALDLDDIRARMQNDGHDFTNDPVYVVNLTTGVPVMLDMGDGNFPLTPRDLDLYFPNDPKVAQENIMLESVEEGAGLMQSQYAPKLDLDFDGVLDHPNTLGPLTPGQIHGVDDLLGWYERESDTLIVQPLLPMEEKTEYAVILTDRLRGPDGQPVRSPFAYVNHPEQTVDLQPLLSILSDPSRANYYGDIAGTGAQHIAFAWTFTTAPVYEDMRLLRDGLYGKGPFASLSTQFPAKAVALRALGMATDPSDEAGPLNTVPNCQAGLNAPYVVYTASSAAALQLIVQVALADEFALTPSQEAAVLDSFQWVDHFVIGEFKSPYLIGSDPAHENPEESFDLNFQTGQGRVTSDTVPFFLAVPKAKPGSQQPFPTAVWSHGTSLFMEESIVRVGYFARQGIATLAIDMPGHGLYLTPAQQTIAQIALGTSCYVEWLSALAGCASNPADTTCAGRAHDLNGDGVPDSGGYLWTSHIFHSRDNIRQSVLDQMQTVRVIKSFDGKTMSDQDYNFDGTPDLAGDFDGDGVPDIGGAQAIYTAGDSYGGVVAMIHGAVDPYVTASAPISGGGGLINIIEHSSLIPAPVLEQIFSPLIIAVPASTRGPTATFPNTTLSAPTNCTGNQLSLRFEVNSLLDSAELEVACLDPAELGPNMTVLVTNPRNGVTHCARTDAQGLLRVPIPANQGDPISIQVYNEPDAVDSYKTCALKSGAKPGRLVATWEQANSAFTPVASGATCPSSSGCQLYWTTYFPVGSQLVAPQEGLGYARQTPDTRRLFSLTQGALDVADPINFAPYYMMKTIPGLDGEALPHRGILDLGHGGGSLRTDRHRQRVRAGRGRAPVSASGGGDDDPRVRGLCDAAGDVHRVREHDAERRADPGPRHPRDRAPRVHARGAELRGELPPTLLFHCPDARLLHHHARSPGVRANDLRANALRRGLFERGAKPLRRASSGDPASPGSPRPPRDRSDHARASVGSAHRHPAAEHARPDRRDHSDARARERLREPPGPARLLRQRPLPQLRRRHLLRYDARALSRHQRRGHLRRHAPHDPHLHGDADVPVRLSPFSHPGAAPRMVIVRLAQCATT